MTYKVVISLIDKHRAKFRNKVKAKEGVVTVITMYETY